MKIAASNQLAVSAARCAAFTMVEIALCLAIIGFALVAIIGVLPTGLNVQRDNREETIINQDAVVWMSAIRNGAQGFNDLTNYVVGITNYWTQYKVSSTGTNAYLSNQDGYGVSGSSITSIIPAPFIPLTNGLRIIGLLSTPTIIPLSQNKQQGAFQSNYFVAFVRAFSGSAVDKAPQNNDTILGSAFTYKLIVENIPYVPFDSSWLNSPASRHYYWNLQTNSHDLRLTFRWPQLPNGDVGNGRQTFRAFAGGTLQSITDARQPLYFIQPSIYTTNAP